MRMSPGASIAIASSAVTTAVVRCTGEARASADMARQALVRACQVLEERPCDPVQMQLIRAWADCVDEILTLTERLCGGLADACAAA